ncbi:hypothetical protein ACIQYZ_13550 [Rhodococcus erythropolis]
MAVTSDDMRAEADRLDAEAALLEGFAAERYDDSARLYTGGSLTFAKSMDTADGYRKEARALRIDARDYRRVADHMDRTATTGARPDQGSPLDGERKKGVPTWQQKLNDVLNK